MCNIKWWRLVSIGMGCLLVSAALANRTVADEQQRIIALERLLIGRVNDLSAEAKMQLAEEKFDRLYVEVKRIRKLARGTSGINVELATETRGTFTFELRNRQVVVDFELSPDKPHRVTSLKSQTIEDEQESDPPLTWKTIDGTLGTATLTKHTPTAHLADRTPQT